MPFGLDLKSIILGALIVWFVVPFVLGHLSKKKAA